MLNESNVFFRWRQGPSLILSRNGIDVCLFGTGLIGWRDVVHVSSRTIRSKRFLCLDLLDLEKYLSRVSPWRRWMLRTNRLLGMPDIVISLDQSYSSFEQVWNLVKQHQGMGELCPIQPPVRCRDKESRMVQPMGTKNQTIVKTAPRRLANVAGMFPEMADAAVGLGR